MSYLILVRHGQSIWNLEKKFTGWVDVDLTENGKSEAKKAGELIKKEEIKVDLYYTSFQLRAKNTLKLIKEILQDNKVFKESWELNERHYGALTGLNKDEMKIKLGEERVHQFRRSWDLRPDPLDKKNEQFRSLITYLIFLSIILEILHYFIPERSFEFSDLFGNLVGVFIVTIIFYFFKKNENFKD